MQTDKAPDFQGRWLDLHSQVPDHLYHYTTPEGLLGIVRDKSLFGTHCSFLNDSLEIVRGKQLVAEVIDEYFDRAEQPIKVALSIFRGAPIDRNLDLYAACFCKQGDLLSQWRAYGKTGGYALAFNGFELSSCCLLPTRGLRKVIYDHSEQERWVRLALDWFVHTVNAVRRNEYPSEGSAKLNDVAYIMWRHLCEMCATFKLDVFREESEWRIIDIVPKNESRSNVENLKFRTKGGILIPW